MKYYFLKRKAISFLLIILIIFSLNFFREDIKNLFYSVSNPFQSFFINQSSSVIGFFEGIKDARELNLENEDLVSQSKRIIEEINSLKNLEKENEELRQALELNIREDFSVTEAYFSSVIDCEDSILINKGYEHGISEGFPVISSEKSLIGIVDKVYENYSLVKLISSEEISFNVEVVSKTSLEENSEEYAKYQGLARGIKGSNLIVELIPKNAEIEEDSFVFTAGSEVFFPKDLLVGTVAQINKNDVESSQTLLVNSLINLSRERIVFIITDY
jgi:rod shape-determining protein MreC